MRKLIAGMMISVDGKIAGPDGYADWVEEWSDSYDVMPRVDACLLGAGMYPGYERRWTARQNQPDKPLPMTGKLPTPAELEWARFAAQTPALCAVEHPDFGSLAEDELPTRDRRNRCPQAATRQGHLSRWGCSNDGKPFGCRAGG